MGSDTRTGSGVPTGVPASFASSATPGQLTGRELGGFTLREVIGAGGYGDVYLAVQEALHRDAIVKVLRQEAMDEMRVQRFLREARLASRLDHPYAAHIYAFGAEDDGVFWIAMEHVRGASLRAVLEAQGPMVLERFVPLLERICEVVQTAHEQGIIHRDLKPDNIMVISRAGKLMPKLLDFGIARALGEEATLPNEAASAEDLARPVEKTTQRGSVLGSPPYMAPEVWRDAHGVGPGADQYALGALAYEALSGRIAFDGRTVMEVARAHAKGVVAPLGDGFPVELDSVISRSLARSPANRYGNMLELAQAFRDAAGVNAAAVDIPELDQELRALYLARAPQPLADAVAGYDAAKNAHQARESLRALVRTSATYVGIVALACRTRVGSGGVVDSEHTQTLLRELRRDGLTSSGWIGLARQLTEPFARLPDTHPMPELVTLLQRARGVDPFASVVEGSLSESLVDPSQEAASQAIARELPSVIGLLRALAFVLDYQLVVARDGYAESWAGARGAGARRRVLLGRVVSQDHPVLVDSDGHPLVSLWPLMQLSMAVPGRTEELFMLAGPGRRGARLVSSPHGFEHSDDGLWDWFREQLFRAEDPEANATAVESPYRGLAAYRASDAAWFFGREREVEVVINRLKVEAFVAVVGPSGVGKSSFVHAGVASALAGFRVVTTRPQHAPLEQLGAALGIPNLREAATADVTTAAAQIRALATESNGLLVVIDQFEETLTLGSSPEERDLFARVLLAATRTPDHPVRVVITLRDDFLIRAEQLPGFDQALARGLQLLGPLGAAALERVVVEPARRAGFEFEDANLPARMVEAVAGTPAAVALISFTATRLWELRDRHFHQLPRKAYEAIGGVAGALALHADETVEAMPAGERALVRKAFRHLVTFEGTRAVLGRDELMQLLGGRGDAEKALEGLIEARLLVSSENEEGEAAVEIIHETLLTAWPRLAEWRREDSEGSRFHEQLRAAAKQWHDRGRPRGALWRGDALAEYELWRKRHPDNLTPVEAAFGGASVASEARGRRLRRLSAAIALVIAAVFVAFLWRANRIEHRMLREATFDQGRMMMLNGDSRAALPYLQHAYEQGETGPANRLLIEEALRSGRARIATFAGHTGRLRAVAFSPDGTEVGTASDDGTARVWNSKTGALIDTIALSGVVRALAFSPDGKIVACGGDEAAVHLWDLEQHRELAPLAGAGPAVLQLSFSGDGHLILVVGAGRIKTMSLIGGAVVDFGPVEGFAGAVFANHDATIAGWDSAGHVGLWDTRSRQPIASHVAAVGDGVGAAAPDGSFVAVATKTGQLDVLRADGTITAITAHDQTIISVAVSPSGSLVATGSADGTAKTWDLAGRPARVFGWGGGPAINVVRFSPNGELLLTACADGSARLWQVRSGLLLGELSGHSTAIFAAAFSTTGDRIVTGSLDSRAIAWDVAKAREFVSLPIGGVTSIAFVSQTAFSRDGRFVAVATADRSLAVLRSVDGALVCSHAFDKPIDQIAWGPDGATIVTVFDSDLIIPVWDARTCTVVHQLRHPRPASCVAFAPNGEIVSGSDDGILRRWDIAGERVVASYPPLPGRIDLVGFDPAEAQIWATTSSETGGALTLLDPAHPVNRRVLAASNQSLSAVTFDPAHHRILASALDQRVWIWDDRSGALITKLDASGVLAGLEMSPDGRFLVGIGGTSPTVWDPDTLAELGTLDGHTDVVGQGGFLPGDLLVTASRDGSVRVWDLATRRSLLILHGADEMALSPQGAVILADGAGVREWFPSMPTPELGTMMK